jgi:peptidyl-prolyl cis-trans isomerase SurA
MDPRRAVILSASLLAASIPAQSTRADVIERVIAVVNDDAIFLSELRQEAAPLTSRAHRASIEETYAIVLERLIDHTLILQAARADDIVVTDADVDRAVESVRAQTGLPVAGFWNAVAQQGFGTPTDYRADVRAQLLELRVLDARRGAWTNVTEADVRRRYDELTRAQLEDDAPIEPYASARSTIAEELRRAAIERQSTALLLELRRAATIERRLD